MPTAIRRKIITRRKILRHQKSRLSPIKPIRIHPPGGLPVSAFELEFERLAGSPYN
jgi:hypothetical protein